MPPHMNPKTPQGVSKSARSLYWITFSGLESDIEEFQFAKKILNLQLLNFWLSDGNTLGKLHMDQYDNLLCQVRI